MRRSRALATGLSLAACVGCGYSTGQIIKPRDPPGGTDQGPDIHNRAIDDLRAVEITVAAKRFQPQQASVGLDSSVRIRNQTKHAVTLRVIKLLGHPVRHKRLGPGQSLEREYLRGGVEVFGLKGSRARLEINVFPSS